MDILIGQTVHNRYQIQSLLGHQTGRRTLLATDLDTQSPVVIKLLLFGPDFTWDDLKLFEREAETLKSLSHISLSHTNILVGNRRFWLPRQEAFWLVSKDRNKKAEREFLVTQGLSL